MAKVCDQCGERGKTAFDTRLVLSRTIPGTGGRQGKARHETISPFNLGDLCEDCEGRYGLLLGNVVGAVKVGETPLPEIPGPEAEEPSEESPEAPQEAQGALPLGGTDEDAGPVAEAPENDVTTSAAPVEATVAGQDNGGAVQGRRRGRPATA